MITLISVLILAALSAGDGPEPNDVRSLIATIETLQAPVKDFRCEFEVTTHFMGKIAETTPVGADGLYETISGTYIWQKGGDVRCESLHRAALDGQISRHTLAVRARDHQATLVYSMGHPREVPNISKPTGQQIMREGLGEIFLIDFIKWMAADDGQELSVSDGAFEGRPAKVLSMALKGLPNSLMAEYYIDLRRNGHVVRIQWYTKGKVLSGWFDIKLAPFKVGDASVWMPVAGEAVGLMAVQDGRPILTKEHTSLRKFRVLDGTMEFNKHPGPEVFTTQYKMGLPVSEALRKLEGEWAVQKARLSSDKGDTEETIGEQLTAARGEKTEVVVSSPSEGIDWTAWIAWGFGALVVISSVGVWMQRRRR
jgi:hypothetical protein